MSRRRRVWTAFLAFVPAMGGVAQLQASQNDAPMFWPKDAAGADAVLAREPAATAGADEWTLRAWTLSRYRSDAKLAAEAAAKALALEPEHYRANEIAGMLAQSRGDYDEAFEHYLKLVGDGRPESVLYMDRMNTLNLTRAQRDRLMHKLEATVADEKTNEVYRACVRRRLAAMHVDRGALEEAAKQTAALAMHVDWMVIGPFNNEENAGFNQAYGPETEIDYAKSYQGRDRDVSWERLRHVGRDGEVDFDAVMYPNAQVLAYALTFVHVDQDRDVVLRFGAGNAVKLWVNDRLLLSSDEDVAFAADQYEAPCRLRAGWNKVLFKVCERADEWKLAVRFAEPDGRPIKLKTDAQPGQVLTARDTPREEATAEFDYARGAQAHFLRMQEQDPLDPAAAFYLGRAQGLTHRKTQAVKAFETLVSLNGPCADHHALLAKSCLVDERPEKALVEMKEAVKLEPEHVECLADLGQFYRGRNLFEKALSTLRGAAELKPNWPDAQYYLLELYSDKDWEEHVWRQARWLLAERPDVGWVLEAYADRCLSRGYREQAKEAYERLLAQEYDNVSARRALLTMAVEQLRPDDALAQYSILLRLQPLSVYWRLDKADLLMQCERHEEALEECRAVLDICGANFRAHKLMASIYQRMGRDDEAMAAWREALKYEPDDKWLREYLEFLEPETIAAFERYGIGEEEAARIVANRVDPSDYPKADAVRLLDHLVIELNEDGSYTSLMHQIVQILNDSGREQYTTMDAGGYRAKIKRAVVIQPDGSETEASRVSGGDVGFGQLQPGSIIEIKSQDRGSANEWLSRHFTKVFRFQGMTPAVRSQFVLLVPKSRTIRYEVRGERVKLEPSEFEGCAVYDFRADDEPMIEPESNRPPLRDIADSVAVSTIEDWDEIARWEYSLVKDQFVADEAVRAKTAELTQGLTKRRDKVRALANFVMRKVQYRQDYDRPIMGMKPHKAGNVLEKEVGDCKDKATLLITMLREAGIPARYVTLRMRSSGLLVREIPSNQCNHAIVYVPAEKEGDAGLWIDGTSNYAGIDTLPWPDQGVEALVFDEQGKIEFMNLPVAPADQSVSQYTVDLHLKADGSARAQFVWDATGQFAVTLRQAFEAEGLRRQRLEQFANYFYPGSRVTSVEFSDLEDRDAPVRITFAFDAPNVGQVSGSKMLLRLREVMPLTQRYANRTDRTYDIWSSFAGTQRMVERFHLPDGFRVDSSPQTARLENDWMGFDQQASRSEGMIEIHRAVELSALTIPRADYDEVRDFCIKADTLQRDPIILVEQAEKSGDAPTTAPSGSRQDEAAAEKESLVPVGG